MAISSGFRIMFIIHSGVRLLNIPCGAGPNFSSIWGMTGSTFQSVISSPFLPFQHRTHPFLHFLSAQVLSDFSSLPPPLHRSMVLLLRRSKFSFLLFLIHPTSTHNNHSIKVKNIDFLIIMLLNINIEFSYEAKLEFNHIPAMI